MEQRSIVQIQCKRSRYGHGTLADSISGYNGGTGAIRDLTVAPDGSGTNYLWGGSAGTALYKMDSLGTRVASYTHRCCIQNYRMGSEQKRILELKLR